MKWIVRIACNTALGFLAILVFNIVGSRFGMSIGLNAVGAVTVGILGVPGFALLLILQYLSL